MSNIPPRGSHIQKQQLAPDLQAAFDRQASARCALWFSIVSLLLSLAAVAFSIYTLVQ